jgi:endoglucanase
MTEETAPDGTVHGTFLHLPTGETLLLDGFDINHPFSDTSGPIPDQFTADNFLFNGTASSATESQHTLSVFLSEDAFQGDAQFTLDVDGVQILGPTSVVVKHGDGFQTFTFTGDMPDSPHSVDIHFINDAYGGSSGEDRNLYVGGIQFDQFSMQGNEASDNAAGGHQADDPNAAVMHIDGTTSFADVAVNGTPGQLPPDSVAMTLHLSEDAYQGDAQFTVDVDGQQVIGPTSVEVAHNSGGNQDFTAFLQQFGQGAHTISINFINDAYGGSSNADRNLYVESIDINGVNFAGNTAADNAAGGHQADDPTGAVMHTNGTVTFTIDEAQPIHSTAPPEIMG